MMQIVPQTREEKIQMYMKLPKHALAMMLVNCNELIDTLTKNTHYESSMPYDMTNLYNPELQCPDGMPHGFIEDNSSTASTWKCWRCGKIVSNLPKSY